MRAAAREFDATGIVEGTSQLAPGFAVDIADGAAAGALRKEVDLIV